MNVSIETMSGLERRLTIAIDSSQFEDQIASRLEDARGKVKLPGFRAGKVPLKEVRRRFGGAIRAEVAGELMQSSFAEAVQQESLTPAGSPKLDVIKMDPGIDFEFTATFEVFPSIELAAFDKIAVRRPAAEITDTDLEEMVAKLREQNATQAVVERPCADGDQVTVDFEGMVDGKRVESACGEGMTFNLGKGQMIEDFDKGVLGLSAGEESNFDAVFPKDYQSEDMQGKTVQFSVKVIDIKESQLPDLNEEFFKKFGIDETTEEAFLIEVKANMSRELDSAIKNQVKQQAMDGLAEIHDFSLPRDVVSREISVLKDQMMGQFQMPPGQTQQLDLPDALFQDQAEKRVRVGLVVNEIMTSKEMVADAEKIELRLQEIAAPYGEPDQVIEWYKSNPEQMNNIEMAVLEDQVVDLIMHEAIVEEVVSNYADVISGAAIAVDDVSEDAEPGA
jgi:trigger factor